MSELKQRIKEAVKQAMRDKNKDRLATLRLITSAFKQKEVDERIELTDLDVLTILDKMCKQRRDSIQQYGQAGREDLIAQEQFELGIIQEYMPSPLTQEELGKLVSEAVAETAADSLKDMNKVMNVLKPQIQGRADMGQVSTMVKSQLN